MLPARSPEGSECIMEAVVKRQKFFGHDGTEKKYAPSARKDSDIGELHDDWMDPCGKPSQVGDEALSRQFLINRKRDVVNVAYLPHGFEIGNSLQPFRELSDFRRADGIEI